VKASIHGMHGLILIVEDEKDLVGTLEYNLQREGFQTVAAYTGQEALTAVEGDPVPDLILLDLMLPDMSGNEICRKIRQEERTKAIPVVILTAKSEEIDRVVGFELGADDYIVKPFSVRELILRIRAIIRRTHPVEIVETPSVIFGRVRIDATSHRVWVDNLEVILTALEFRLLETFIERRGRVQTRERLLDDVWGIQADVTTRTVDTHVKRLRQKIGVAGEYVETIRGVGYRFRDRPNED
jgi:two-component system, OmpR family, phosphate regulon response regulator PhoB